MKRVGLVLGVALLIASLISPGHAADSRRRETQTYSMTSGFLTWSSEGSISAGSNWAMFTPRVGERTVSLSISDASERPVLGRVFFWDAQRQDWADRDAEFCSATERPLRVRPHETVYVGAYLGTCDDGTLSVVTTGTITAIFTK
jgi:hypothetical protein